MNRNWKKYGQRALLSVALVCLTGDIALSYPQLGSSFREAFAIGAFTAILLLWLMDREDFITYAHRMFSDPVVWGTVFLFVWGLTAALATGFQHADTANHLDIFRKLMLKGGMTFVVITYVCYRTKSTSLIFVILAVVGVAACLDVFIGHWQNSFGITNRDAVHTLMHKRIHVNLISRKLNFVAPFFVAWVWFLAGRSGKRWPIYPATIFVLLASFYTISRAGWLGAAGGLFFLFLFVRDRKPLMIFVAIFIAVFCLAYMWSKDVRMHVATLKQRLPNISERLPNWRLCVRAIGQRPIWGWGVFEKRTFHRMVRIVDGDKSKILKYHYPHNIFLEIPLLWGVPFLLVMMALFFYIYWKGWAAARSSELGLCLHWAALAGATIGAFWINGFFSKVVWPNVFIALGLASSLLALNNGKSPPGKSGKE